MEGKYFTIHSGLDSQLVLDIEDGSTELLSHVVTQYHTGADSQLWYNDTLSGSIRNKQTNFTLDYDFDKNVIVNEHQLNNKDQIWRFEDGCLFNEPNGKVLDIAGVSTDPGTFVVGWDKNDGPSQRWTCQHVPPEFFFVKNKMNGDCLDITEAKEEPGVPIVTWARKKKEFENQLWYEGQGGVLRSKLGDFAIDDSEPKCIQTAVYEPMSAAQVWIFSHGKIVNGPANVQTVLEVKGRPMQKRMNGAKVASGQEKKGESEQIWELVYLDE